MAGATAVIKRNATIDGLKVSDTTNTVSDDGVFKFSKVVPAGTVGLKVTIAIKASAITAITIDGTQPTHVYTNNSVEGSAHDVFIVSLNNEIQWVNTFATANPVTADITGIWVSVPGAIDSTVNIVILYHVES